MRRSYVLAALGAVALLSACEMKIGKDKEEGGNAAQTAKSAEGQSEVGSISIDAPGFDMKLQIPEALRAQMGTDGDILYPGAKFAALHVQAADGSGDGDDSVEIRFNTTDAPDKVVAWYRDPARAKDMTVASAEKQGDGYHITGTSADDQDPFTLNLTPAAGGGTDGQLVLADRHSR